MHFYKLQQKICVNCISVVLSACEKRLSVSTINNFLCFEHILEILMVTVILPIIQSAFSIYDFIGNCHILLEHPSKITIFHIFVLTFSDFSMLHISLSSIKSTWQQSYHFGASASLRFNTSHMIYVNFCISQLVVHFFQSVLLHVLWVSEYLFHF